MTKLEKVLSMNTGCSKLELIFTCCPHDFGIEDDSKYYKGTWECEAPSGGCKECWNKEVENDKT